MVDDAETRRKIAEVQERYGHLLTREAALALVNAEKARAGGESFSARILRIFQPYHFEKAGRRGKVCRVEIERLDSGKRPLLVLWDSDADRLGKELRVGDVAEVRGAYEKEGELHIGRLGSIALAERASTAEAKEAAREARRETLAVIRDLRAEGEALHAVLELHGKEHRIEARGRKALLLLGLKAGHEGVPLSTLVELKREHLIGKAVRLDQHPGERD